MTKFALAIAAAALCGCASIMHGTRQDVGISSSPTGAKVVVDNGAPSTTPYVAKLSRKDNHIVKLTLDGFAPAELTLTKSVSGWVWGNLVFGGLIGLAVDAISGGLYNLTPDQLQSALSKQVGSTMAPAKDGVYIVLVRASEPGWVKLGQLDRL